MPADIYDITLTTLTYGGDALGRLPENSPRPGLAVFVPCALPGETVRVRLLEEKRGHARAELLEVLTSSPDRISPRCPHFFSILNQQSEINNFSCGGCHYQHLSYTAQLAAKSTILRDQLERLGGVKDPPIQPPVPSPNPWNYRNHVQFRLTPQGRLGFDALQSHRVIPIRECHLPEAPINQLWPQIDLEPLPDLERVSVRMGADEELMLILEGGDPRSLEIVIEELPISVLHLGPAGVLVLAGSDHIVMEVTSTLPRMTPQGCVPLSPDPFPLKGEGEDSGNRDALGSKAAQSIPISEFPPNILPVSGVLSRSRLFRVSAESFFQVNTPQAGAMIAHLLANLPLSPTTTLLEVYCGVGLFSAFLAPSLGRLIGIESSPSACQDFISNLNEFDNVELYEAAAEQALPALDLRPDVILVDPPRAGLGPRVLDGILGLNAAFLAYVSCDPATLARDARRLIEADYHLRQITPFDLFPQTYHIESISFWEK